MSRLFVVATPIGNLGDITLRALEVLRSVGHIAAEDTRHTAKLLRHYEIATPLISYHEHNHRRQLPRILALLSRGNVALVSDAGTPGISDPGAELVNAAEAAGHQVVPLPGPSALSAILSVAGCEPGPVHFLGFLPRKRKGRRDLIKRYAVLPGVTVFFETPHRLQAALADIAAVAGAQQLVVGRELTQAPRGDRAWTGRRGRGAARHQATARRVRPGTERHAVRGRRRPLRWSRSYCAVTTICWPGDSLRCATS